MIYFDSSMFLKHMWSEQIRNSLIIIGVLIILAILFGLWVKKVKPTDKPPLLLVILEQIIGLINGLVKMVIGKRWKSFAPYMFTVFLFLAIANISGLFLLTPPTSSWNVTLGLALITFGMIHFTGVRSLGVKEYVKGYFAPLPVYVPVLFPINLLSEFTFPLSLSLRLFGNILSGVVISILLYGVISNLAWAGWVIVLLMPIFHLIFDLFFGIIQAVVFILLSSIFIGQKIDEKELIAE